jgi:hypothetical protein
VIRKLVVAAFALGAILVPSSSATAQEGPCDTNYFPEEDMWEITWGRQFSDDGALPTFTQQSYGGLVGLNDGPVPQYMVDNPDWQWLYVTGAQIEAGRTVTYHFADGTLITAVATADGDGCPAVVWTVGQEPGEEVPPGEEPTPGEEPAPSEEPTPVETEPAAAAPVGAAPSYTG